MENSENHDLAMAGVTDQITFFELQKARNPSKYWGFWCRKWDSNPHGGLAQRILSPPRLPIPSFRQICCFKIVSSEIGGRFGGRFWKIAAMQFSKSPKLLGFSDLKRRRARWILSPPRLPIPTHRQEFSSKNTTPEIGGHFGGQTSKIKDIQFSKAQINRAVPASEREMTHWILSPSRLPIPSHRQNGYR